MLNVYCLEAYIEIEILSSKHFILKFVSINLKLNYKLTMQLNPYNIYNQLLLLLLTAMLFDNPQNQFL